MRAAIEIVAPVFALIVLGFIAGRREWVSKPAAKGLIDFTFLLATPALLFRTVATTPVPAASALGVLGSFFGALAVTWILAALATRVLLRRPAADGAAIAMSAGYGNVVMLGIPLAASAYGPAAAAPIAIIMAIHSPLLWLAGSLHLALVDRSTPSGLGEQAVAVVRDLSRNPIIIAVLAGALWQTTGLGLDPIPDRILAMLAQAAIPCALVALGLSLASFEIKGQIATLVAINALKLIAMPLVAAMLALGVARLDPVSAGVVVLLAAMPTGANAFIFATKHQRAVNSTSGSVALGSLLSAATIAIAILLLPKP